MGLRNIVGGVFILAFTLYYGGLATLLPKRTTTDAPGPHFFPYLNHHLDNRSLRGAPLPGGEGTERILRPRRFNA